MLKMPIWKKVILAIAVLIPLVLGALWFNYVREAERAATGSFLSPVNNAPIIIMLILFMGGYVLFLFVMFYDNIKELVHKSSR